ncbi:MAG: tRNA pseudouridine(54/55) synthase Pus10 [Desulfurococcales archaeon]|nr:tRNA pseudouridine(54/55) synthase Pus10 [Desulfurococcales archaeon]
MESTAYSNIINLAIEILRKYPLCDRCLGRMFARLGRDLSNKERGKALKLLIVLHLHNRILSGDQDAIQLFKEIAPNIGRPARGLYEELFKEELHNRNCSICRNKLENVITTASIIAYNKLREWDIDKFLVGARAPFETIRIEESIKTEYGLVYSESIKNEVKREVGKKLQDYGLTVDFDNPEGVVVIDLWDPHVTVQVNPIFFKGFYWKTGRNISQSYWPTRWGLKYEFSVEQATWSLKNVMKAEKTIIHAAGREDADARMLGTGRPLVVEVKRPRKRKISLSEVETALNMGGKGLVHFKITGFANRFDVRLYKNELSNIRKLYKALVVSESPLSHTDLSRLESEFSERIIRQRTPTRVLHRRSDLERNKKVYKIKNIQVSDHVFYSFILAEGGLYIKELISGDDGRTQPSFADVLNTTTYCVDLDVIGIDFDIPGHL